MPRLKYKKKGKRVNVWIPDRQMKVASQIDNLSNFFQICLDAAPDIMAWAILKDYDPKKYNTGRQLDDVIDNFNEKYPQNELTQKRQGTWPKNSEKKQELW
jgi:hypothetical protein